MKTSKIIQACLITLVITLAACAGKKDDNTPKAKAPVDPAQAQAEQQSTETPLCSKAIEDICNVISDENFTNLDADVLILKDKACDKLIDQVKNSICHLQSDQETIHIVSKDLVKNQCDQIKSALAVKTKTDAPVTKTEEKSENKTTAPVKLTEVKQTAPPKDTTSATPAATTETAAVESKKVTDLPKGLTLKLNRPDVFEGVRKTFSKVQEGLYVESEVSLDAKKGTCYLDGTDTNLVFAKDQTFTFTKIEATAKGLSMISINPKVELTCLKASSIPNPLTEWTIQDVQTIMDEAADLSEAK